MGYVASLVVAQGLAHGMRYDEIRKHLNDYFVEAIKRNKELIAEKGRLGAEKIDLFRRGAAYGTDAYQIGLEGSPQLKSFFDWSGLTVEEGSKDHNMIASEYEGAYSAFCQQILDYDKSLSRYEFVMSTGASSSTALNGNKKSTTLNEVVKLFVDEQMGAKVWRGKSEQDKRSHYDLIMEILGSDFRMSDFTEDDALKVKGVVLKLPTNRNKREATRKLSLDALLTIDHPQKLSTKTRNQYLMSYASLFSWARRHRFVSENYFEGLQIKTKKLGAKDKRLSFDPQQLKSMFRELTTNENGLIKKPYQKWGSLIAIFTGARLNEIAQLALDDLKEEEGFHYFDINEIAEDKQLKNEASARKVPIHSRLLELGLMEYVKKLRINGTKKLFPDFSYSKNTGYGRNLSFWFNQVFLVKMGIKSKQLVLHSLRHTMITELLRAGVEEAIVKEIVGHEKAGTTQLVYHKGYTLTQRAEALEKFGL